MSTEKRKEEAAQASECFKAMLGAIPKGKFAKVFQDASNTELYLARGTAALALLDVLRSYFLDPARGGEESPFVKKIDQIIPRD